MKSVIMFIISYVIVYLIYYLLVINKEEKLKKFKKSTEFKYLKKVYKIDFNKFDLKWVSIIVVMANSLIISLTALLAINVKSTVLMLLMGFVLLFPIILIVYHLLGKYLQAKQK